MRAAPALDVSSLTFGFVLGLARNDMLHLDFWCELDIYDKKKELAARSVRGDLLIWARDGAVQEQIDASIKDELNRLQSRAKPVGESLRFCAECEEDIPQARREAIPGVKLCLECQQDRDGAYQLRAGINRRGSKDSQLK